MTAQDSYYEGILTVVHDLIGIEKMKCCSVLLTGATGMICSTVAELLFALNKSENMQIKIIFAGRSEERIKSRFGDWIEGKDYVFFPFDATLNGDINIAVDYIIHGASNASPSGLASQPVETMLCNLIGLNNLLRMAAKGNAKRLLYISSSEVYGKKNDNLPYKEDEYGYVDILNPRAAYPSSKRAAETLCVSYGKEYGVDTVIVRPGHIYGPSITSTDNRASAQFTRSAVAGENIVMKSPGKQLRSYCYTVDCASAILMVLLNGKSCQAYNISNRDSIVTIHDVAEALAEESGVQIVFQYPTEAENQSYNLMDNSALDATKLEKLGWSARYDLKTGIRQTIAHMKK